MRFLTKQGKLALKVGNVVVGVVLGVVLKDMIQSSFSAIVVIIALLATAILVVLVTQEEIRAKATEIARDVEDGRDKQHAEIDVLSASLSDSMASLTKQFGLRVEYLLTSEVNKFQSIDQDNSARKILSAEKELLVLDLISKDGCWPDDAMNQGILSDAFGGMISLTESSPSLFYKRIVQVADLNSGLHNARNPIFIKHCQDILRLRRETEDRAVLKMVRRRFPFKFVLIDNECLILQLQEYDGDAFKLWGELRIIDPSRSLISIFRKIWDGIDNDAVAVTIDDLPPAPDLSGKNPISRAIK